MIKWTVTLTIVVYYVATVYIVRSRQRWDSYSAYHRIPVISCALGQLHNLVSSAADIFKRLCEMPHAYADWIVCLSQIAMRRVKTHLRLTLGCGGRKQRTIIAEWPVKSNQWISITWQPKNWSAATRKCCGMIVNLSMWLHCNMSRVVTDTVATPDTFV